MGTISVFYISLRCNFRLILFALFICLLHNQINASDVLGCNGFVKSNVGDIDYTNVEVKL